MPEKLEGSEVDKLVLAWVSLDRCHVHLSALVSSLAVGIMSFVSLPKITRTLSPVHIPSANASFIPDACQALG